MTKKTAKVVITPANQASSEYFYFNGHRLELFGFEGRKVGNQMQIRYAGEEWEALSPPPGAPMIGQVLVQHIEEIKREGFLSGAVVTIELPDWAAIHLYLEGKLLIPSINSATLKKTGDKAKEMRFHFSPVDLGGGNVVEVVGYPTIMARRRKRPEIKFFDGKGDFCNMFLLGPSSN